MVYILFLIIPKRQNFKMKGAYAIFLNTGLSVFTLGFRLIVQLGNVSFFSFFFMLMKI
jgi:hypothetical protein